MCGDEAGGCTWITPDVALSIGRSPIKFVGVDEPFTYLGLTYTLAKGSAHDHHLRALEDTVVRMDRLALKPHQKSQLLMQNTVPAFAHRLTIDPPSLTTLRWVDATIHGQVKCFLHLGFYTTDCLLYGHKRDGGLVFPSLPTGRSPSF